MPVRLGISPIGWSNDDLPELGGDTPLDTCLAEAREARFAGIELGHKFPRDSPVLRLVLQRHGVSLISGWYSGRLLTLGHGQEEAWWRRFCQALAAIGYDDVLSIEHEDFALPPVDGVALLRRVIASAV